MRIEVCGRHGQNDGRATRLVSSLRRDSHLAIESLAIVEVYLLDGLALTSFPAGVADIEEIFSDRIAQQVYVDTPALDSILPDWDYVVEVAYRPGVTDPVAITAREAVCHVLVGELEAAFTIQTARQHVFRVRSTAQIDSRMLSQSLYNPLIQRAHIVDRDDWNRGRRLPAFYSSGIPASRQSCEFFSLGSMGDAQLKDLSHKRLLALSVAEMRAIRDHYSLPRIRSLRTKRDVPEAISDVELEMIAQTWSEHCKHKIFNATINYTETTGSGTHKQVIHSLFDTYIKRTTEELTPSKTFLRSVFHDNSGVIQFDTDTLLCFKVETHNSPSALDPYGGAITGIVGVNRDILGTGKAARPLFNTNVLCFGYPRSPDTSVPTGLLHPRRVMEGVHKGIIDGGNQSGIPVVAGAFLFDESYLGKPLVYCGTGGILPSEIAGEPAWIKHVDAGDLAVMVGGRIGKDGIHGATFSSQPLSEESPTSAVQIGDPITQKRMLDFLIEARDLCLFKGLTDNGAGGLSSSLGEMAELSGGVSIELSHCPLKYQGLAPWEILLSESQERMSLAVASECKDELLALAVKRDVEATVVGEFTANGLVEIHYEGELVGLVELEFLHHGLPRMEIDAEWQPVVLHSAAIPPARSIQHDLLALLSEPNVASKEELVRQYDHEVQALSIVKPFVGERADGPADGAVLRPRYDSYRGISVCHGVCPRYGDIDTYHMATCAVDEAVRSHVGLGGDPDAAAALDNFCWPDPIHAPHNLDGKHKLAQLVRAVRGLRDACLAYGLPLISGKDSMKNDAVIGDRKYSVRPTLLVSLLGIVPDVRKAITTDFKHAGALVYLLGETRGELGGSLYERHLGLKLGACPTTDPQSAARRYHLLFHAIQAGLVCSCHDLSDGGLGVALCECALGGRLGVSIQLEQILGMPGTSESLLEETDDSIARLVFSETPSRFIISVDPQNQARFAGVFAGIQCAHIGTVLAEQNVVITHRGRCVVSLPLSQVERAWKEPI